MTFNSLFCRIVSLALVARHVAGELNEMSNECKKNYDLEVLPNGAEISCIESEAYEGERCYYTYIPDCAGVDSPLVFDLHGRTGCPYSSADYTGWAEKADENCFVLVYPRGNTDREISSAACWAVPGGLEDETVDKVTSNPCCCEKDGDDLEPTDSEDALFLRQVAAAVTKDVEESTSSTVTIDTKRIYMGGHSNGCFMSTYMAATMSDMVAAVACHAGGSLALFPANYSPRPIWMVHGTWDWILPYNSADGWRGMPKTHEVLANINGCTSTIEESFTEPQRYQVLTSSSCTNDATVQLVTLNKVEHSPFLGLGGFFFAKVKVDTTQLAWDFVKSYSLDEAPNFCEDSDTFRLVSPKGQEYPCSAAASNQDQACGLSQDGQTLKGMCPEACDVFCESD